MKALFIIGIVIVLIAGYYLINQASSNIENQASTTEIESTLDDAGNTLLEETNDITIGDLI